VALEFIARLVTETLRINPRANPMSSMLLDKHFLRKHGPSAYYGQPAPGQHSRTGKTNH
jgi:L-ribulose-5-phosphate 4-epimerase